MQKKNAPGSTEWVDPDDAPELTPELLAKAEIWRGDKFVEGPRRPGRPKSGAPKEQISVRLDQDVLTKLRASGPGWQSRVNGILRQALGLDEQKAA